MDSPVLNSTLAERYPVTLTEQNGRFFVRAPREARSVIGSCNAALLNKDNTVECPVTPVAAYELFRTFEVRNASEKFLSLARHGRKVLSRIDASEDDGEVLGHLGSATVPWEWQRRARLWLERMLAIPGSGAFLYMGLGTGKTRTCLDLSRRKAFQRILVAAPKSVLPAWEKQARLHYPGIFEVVVLDKGSVSKRAKELSNSFIRQTKPTIIVANYDVIWRLEFAHAIARAGFDLCIADECHRLKGRSTSVGKFFRRMWRYIPYRIGMTGTPLSNGALTDFWGQALFIDQGLFGPRITTFEANYAWRHPKHPFIVQWRNVDHFMDRFWAIAHHQDRAVLELPEVMVEERTYQLAGPAKSAYVGMRDEFVAELKQGTVTAANAAVRVGKLQQITSGRVLNADGTALVVHDEKRGLLEDLLREADDEPVVVFCLFKADLAQVHEASKRCRLTSSELSGSRNDLEDWQNGATQVLAVQIRAGSEGIDLTRACIGIFFSQTPVPKDRDQCIGRIHRPGQHRNTAIYDLIADGAIDRQIQQSLENKRDLIRTILEGKEVM